LTHIVKHPRVKRACLADLYPILVDSDAEDDAQESIGWKYGLDLKTMSNWTRNHNDRVKYIEDMLPEDQLDHKMEQYFSQKEQQQEETIDQIDILVDTELWEEWMLCVKDLPFELCLNHFQMNNV